VHDFDGDGKSEYAVSSANNYTVFEGDAAIVWKAPVSDGSGMGRRHRVRLPRRRRRRGDVRRRDHFLFIFDGAGRCCSRPRAPAGTFIEYPVVADVDNDGSAEIVVVSNSLGTRPRCRPRRPCR
jgi:hypothetical protein